MDYSVLFYRVHSLGNEDLALLELPAHYLRQEEKRETLNRLADEQVRAVADLLQLRIGSPRADRDPNPTLDNVNEAGFMHVINHAGADANLEGLAEPLARFLEGVVPLREDVVGVSRDDVGVGPYVELLVLEPAPRLQVIKRLPV